MWPLQPCTEQAPLGTTAAPTGLAAPADGAPGDETPGGGAADAGTDATPMAPHVLQYPSVEIDPAQPEVAHDEPADGGGATEQGAGVGG